MAEDAHADPTGEPGPESARGGLADLPPPPAYSPFLPPAPLPPLPPGVAPTRSPAPYVAARTSGWAIASLVFSIVAPFSFPPLSLVAVFFGHLALGEIRRGSGAVTGRALAIVGLILGYCGLTIVGLVVLQILVLTGLFTLPR